MTTKVAVKIAACLSCGTFYPLEKELHFMLRQRCSSCRTADTFKGKYGSLLVQAAEEDRPAPVMTQRELAELKRELYRTEKIIRDIDARKAQFMQRAMEEANAMVADVEEALGTRLPELRKKNAQLKARLKHMMESTGQSQIRIRNLVVDLKYEVVNRGNQPLWTVITKKMADLLRWSEEELDVFKKANYSVAEYGYNLYMQFLKPGKKKPVVPPPTEPGKMAYYQLRNLSLPVISNADTHFKRGTAKECVVDSPDGTFILTGSLVRENGLSEMVRLQQITKGQLSVYASDDADGRHYLAITGEYVEDPNTVRAFLHEQYPDHRIANVSILGSRHIAVELDPMMTESAVHVADDFFRFMIDTIDQIEHMEMQRATLTDHLSQQVTANFSDTPDADVTDLSLAQESPVSTTSYAAEPVPPDMMLPSHGSV